MDYSNIIKKSVFKVVKAPTNRWKLMHDYPEIFFHPHMKPDEYHLFKMLCKDKRSVLEYGSGGSTIYFLKNHKKVYSVESNPEFYNFMTSIDLVKNSLKSNLQYEMIDMGPTNQWGKPTASEYDKRWAKYYTNIWDSIQAEKGTIDIIFIDGRFRVCCCLYSILKVIEYNWLNTIFIIHDFWRRKQYHAVLQFLDEIRSSRNLAAFEIKKDINSDKVRELLHEYRSSVE